LVLDAFERIADSGVDQALLDLLRMSPHCASWSASAATATSLPTPISTSTVRLSAPHRPVVEGERNRGPPRRARGGDLSVPDPPVDQELVTQVVLGYLRQRILPSINDEQAGLAQLLADAPAAEAQLRQLEADGLLYPTVKDGETVYRCPPAARRAIVNELQERSPDRLRSLYARLARLYAANGQPATALSHALNAEDWSLVIQVIEQHWRPLLVSHPDLLHPAH
jgi:hypothetical protein